MNGSTPDDSMDDYESGPFCKHWDELGNCEECAAELVCLQEKMEKAWNEGYQARQNDMGAADVTPNPYRSRP
jgi:hypothetical protein